MISLFKKYRAKKKLQEQMEEWRHARELAIWNGPKFKNWQKEFEAAYKANRNAALRATLRRNPPPDVRQ